jgi:hypothetical protein
VPKIRAACGEEKRPRPFTRMFRATYRWNMHRQAFVTMSRAFKQLAKVNTKLNTTGPPWKH